MMELNDKIKLFSFFYFFVQKKLQTAASEDDSELANIIDEITLADQILRPVPGGPFSALTPSMWPQDILAKLGQPEVNKKEKQLIYF